MLWYALFGIIYCSHLVVCLEVINLFVEGMDPELLTDEHNCIEFILESRLIS